MRNRFHLGMASVKYYNTITRIREKKKKEADINTTFDFYYKK